MDEGAMHVSLATQDAGYEAHLDERLRSSSVDELKTGLALFDCARLRLRNVGLIERLRAELARQR